MPAAVVRARLRGDRLRARRHRLVELRARHHLVDQPPLDRALALHAFFGGAEHVGAVAPHLALVGDAGEPAGAGQHREQRQLGQRHGGRAVVHQHDVVAGERELVAAAGRGAVHDAEVFLVGVLARFLDRIARLVGELAEVDLVRVRRARQHADVGAGAEHAVLGRLEDDDLHLRVLEAQPLDRVGELDVDAEVVGVELELIAAEQAGLLVHVHGEGGDLAVGGELPVAVARRLGAEVDRRGDRNLRAVGALFGRLSHGCPPKSRLNYSSCLA